MPIIPDVVGITSNQRLRTLAAERVPGASLRFFRVVFAAVVAISALRLLILDWTSTLYSNPTIHFAYSGLGWVPVLPSTLMRIQVAAIAIAAVAVAFGFMYRYSIALVWFLFSWMEFTEATVYLNHYWFISVMSFLMIFLPLDSRGTVPRGTLWMVRFQVGVVYIFAGLAKINTDWLLQGLPMALWLPGRTDLPIVGPMLNHQSVAIALAWGGAIFDCAVVWFLLWRRTRLWAWLCVVAFHIATFILFPPIGVFPFLMVAASLVFFEPDWPIELAGRVTGWLAGRQVMPDAFARRLESAGQARMAKPDESDRPARAARPIRRLTFAAAILWVSIQILLPLRQYLIPGDARWTGEGFRFGWNVLAVERAGDVTFRVTDTTTGRTRSVPVDTMLTTQQRRVVPVEPELIRQAAHHLADVEAERLGIDRDQVAVRADAFVSVNGRRARRLIDPKVDLAAEPAGYWHQSWILPGP